MPLVITLICQRRLLSPVERRHSIEAVWVACNQRCLGEELGMFWHTVRFGEYTSIVGGFLR